MYNDDDDYLIRPNLSNLYKAFNNSNFILTAMNNNDDDYLISMNATVHLSSL